MPFLRSTSARSVRPELRARRGIPAARWIVSFASLSFDAATLVVLICAIGPVARAADEPKAAAPEFKAGGSAPATAAPMPTSGCKDCHEEQIAALARTVHRGATTAAGFTPPDSDLQASCVTCHGPIRPHGEEAAKGGVSAMAAYKKLTAAERSAPCLTCHAGPLTLHWSGSVHDTQDVSCTDCHRMHPSAAPVPGLPGKQDEVATCLSCHRTVAASVWQSSHHPVREGRMFCTGCHEPHGTMADAQLKRTTVNETCYMCHAEKRGPYLWTHPPAMENCLNCHVAHASLHNALLIQKPPRLCQTCHNAPLHVSNPHNYRSHERPQLYVFNKGCDNCHQVHGSNSPSGPTLLR